MRIQTGEKPYACTACYKIFSQKENLMHHQIIHIGKDPINVRNVGKPLVTLNGF
jgi:KRAB domain-containing zinc finger protein